jgi:hypothetical protein
VDLNTHSKMPDLLSLQPLVSQLLAGEGKFLDRIQPVVDFIDNLNKRGLKITNANNIPILTIAPLNGQTND